MVPIYIHWNINPELLNLFGISIRYYGVLFVSGLLLCNYVLAWIFKREKLPEKNLQKLFIYGVISILAGARLGHCLFYEPAYYLKHPLEIILPIQASSEGGYIFTGYQGLASHGGTVGLIIAMILYAFKTKEPVVKTIDIIAIVAPLGACFIRLANLMNSEIIGTPTSVSWGFIFERVDHLPRHPAQLYEALAYFSIFGLVLWLYKTGRVRLNTGILFGITISLIFTARFFIEFIKEKQVAFEEQMKLDMGQILSIPMILVAIGFIISGIKKNNAKAT